MSPQKPEMWKVDGIFLVAEWPLLVPHDTDLLIMVIKSTSFCPELIFKTISKLLANFTENAIFRVFIKVSFLVEFKSFSVFLIKCVMKVTCKLKSAEKVNIRKSYPQNLIMSFFSKTNNT